MHGEINNSESIKKYTNNLLKEVHAYSCARDRKVSEIMING